MYPHKHNLLFIFIVLLSFQTIEAKNTENKSTDLNSKNTTTVSDFSNILNSPISTFSQSSEQQADATEYEEYDNNKKYTKGDIVYFNCMVWEKSNGSGAGTTPGKSNGAWKFVEYYNGGGCTFYNGVPEFDSSIIYQIGMSVYYNCTIWTKTNGSGAGTTPGKSNGAWEFVNYYDGGDCKFIDGVLEFDSSIIYQIGMSVYYNCTIWTKTNGSGAGTTPGKSNGAWEFVNYYDGGNCTFYNGVLEFDPSMIYENSGFKVYYNGKIWISKKKLGAGNTPTEGGWAWGIVGEYIPEIDTVKYHEEAVYQPETEIYFNCTLWKKVDNSPAGTAPGDNNDAWEFVEYFENSNECTFIDGVPEYDDTMTYLPGMEVYYDGNVWVNNTTNQKISGDTPNFTDSEWSAKNSSTLSVADDILKENITLYYNSNRIYYDFTKLENSSQIVCYDVKGSMIFSKEINNEKDVIELPSIQQGLYFLQVLNNNAKTFKKIIVL
ncbi:T9SS type A sorting domain-containing protein [Lutibacter sp. A80]|uniref:T9SS type A sorting domain-containing protein n=1 Tax=Lutibacter sp. A80 TaxID=2918453 RepID=UPI001F067294|nr:T9SS type A sorting domain-containing protein [Lutibacter sp. A80]UMB61473.1 T9SS type A sorting domain-containing protein [Lutibacter sp. A80]